MQKFEIMRNVTAEGKAFEAGQIVEEKDVPHTCVSSMLRVGYMREIEPVEPKPEAPTPGQPDQPAGEPVEAAPVEKKKRGRPAKVKPEAAPKPEGDPEPQPEPEPTTEPEPASDEPKPEGDPEPEPIPAGI